MNGTTEERHRGDQTDAQDEGSEDHGQLNGVERRCQIKQAQL